MSLYVVLDGGGTKTECWVADDTRIVGRAATESVKLMRVGEAVATERLQQVVHAALADAGGRAEDVGVCVFGLAGVSLAAVKAWALQTLRVTLPQATCTVCGDHEIALDAAFGGGPGVLVIAGTGSNVVGRCADGTRHTAGGWGPVIGDEGSGYWIGVEAIKAGLRAEDRGVSTCVLAEIEEHWGLSDRSALVALANATPRPDFAALTTVVARCADGGDALAASILERAGVELAAQVRLVASKMHAGGCAAADAQRVAFTGSVLAKIPRVRRAMQAALVASMPGVAVADGPVEPLEGALWRARGGEQVR